MRALPATPLFDSNPAMDLVLALRFSCSATYLEVFGSYILRRGSRQELSTSARVVAAPTGNAKQRHVNHPYPNLIDKNSTLRPSHSHRCRPLPLAATASAGTLEYTHGLRLFA
jgi:hypothetical protein